MSALVSVLALALAGPDAASAPLSPTADSKAIFAAIRAGDPKITKPPASLDSLVAATEMAEEKLRQVDNADDADDMLTLVVQGRRAAYGRTSDAAHLCRLVAATDHVALKTSNAASDFRRDAERDLGAHRCGDEAPALPSTPPDQARSVPPPVVTPKPGPPPPRLADRQDHRRVRAGVGTLVPGLVLLAPMAALLAVRAGIRGDLADLAEATATRPATEAETTRFALLDDRYGATTAAAAVLGVTGGALVVTGVVLLATKRRQPRAALAPWGGGGVGGFVLHGRF